MRIETDGKTAWDASRFTGDLDMPILVPQHNQTAQQAVSRETPQRRQLAPQYLESLRLSA